MKLFKTPPDNENPSNTPYKWFANSATWAVAQSFDWGLRINTRGPFVSRKYMDTRPLYQENALIKAPWCKGVVDTRQLRDMLYWRFLTAFIISRFVVVSAFLKALIKLNPAVMRIEIIKAELASWANFPHDALDYLADFRGASVISKLYFWSMRTHS